MQGTSPIQRDQSLATDARTVAQRLGVSLAYVRTMIRNGQLPASRLGHRVLIAHRDVDALLTRSRITAPAGG